MQMSSNLSFLLDKAPGTLLKDCTFYKGFSSPFIKNTACHLQTYFFKNHLNTPYNSLMFHRTDKKVHSKQNLIKGKRLTPARGRQGIVTNAIHNLKKTSHYKMGSSYAENSYVANWSFSRNSHVTTSSYLKTDMSLLRVKLKKQEQQLSDMTVTSCRLTVVAVFCSTRSSTMAVFYISILSIHQ